MHTHISGKFVKIVWANQVDLVLSKSSAGRPPGRYNRPEEATLYLSQNEQSARVALQKYLRPNDPPRVLIEYQLNSCQLVDLRHPAAAGLYTRARNDWRAELQNDIEPQSWQVSDKLRRLNEIGLIDPSRKSPDQWHITLFKWNEVGAPSIKQVSQPRLVIL